MKRNIKKIIKQCDNCKPRPKYIETREHFICIVCSFLHFPIEQNKKALYYKNVEHL